MDMSHYQPVRLLQSLRIDLSASHDKAFLKIGGFRYLECLLERAGYGYFFSSGEPTGNDDVHTTGEGTSDGLECLAAHDHGPSEGLPLEELEVFGNMPQELVVFSYGIVVSYRYYDVLLHDLHCYRCRDTWIRIIIYEFEILVLEIEDALHIRIYLHLRELARLAGELQGHLLEVICINMGITGSVNEFSRLQTAYLCDHHGQESIGSDIERHTEEHIRTALIKLA